MAHYGEVERLRHACDLEQAGDATRTHQVDHDDVDRTCFEHVAEGHAAIDVFAARDRSGQRIGHARDGAFNRWIDNLSYDWLSEKLRRPQDKAKG